MLKKGAFNNCVMGCVLIMCFLNVSNRTWNSNSPNFCQLCFKKLCFSSLYEHSGKR